MEAFPEPRPCGEALKLAVKQLEDKPSKELEGTVQDLASQLGWTHVTR